MPFHATYSPGRAAGRAGVSRGLSNRISPYYRRRAIERNSILLEVVIFFGEQRPRRFPGMA